jgi:hypothetical protein
MTAEKKIQVDRVLGESFIELTESTIDASILQALFHQFSTNLERIEKTDRDFVAVYQRELEARYRKYISDNWKKYCKGTYFESDFFAFSEFFYVDADFAKILTDEASEPVDGESRSGLVLITEMTEDGIWFRNFIVRFTFSPEWPQYNSLLETLGKNVIPNGISVYALSHFQNAKVPPPSREFTLDCTQISPTNLSLIGCISDKTPMIVKINRFGGLIQRGKSTISRGKFMRRWLEHPLKPKRLLSLLEKLCQGFTILYLSIPTWLRKVFLFSSTSTNPLAKENMMKCYGSWSHSWFSSSCDTPERQNDTLLERGCIG